MPNKKPGAKILHIFCNVYRQPNQNQKNNVIYMNVHFSLHPRDFKRKLLSFVSVPQVNDIQIECKNTNTNRMQTCFSFSS